MAIESVKELPATSHFNFVLAIHRNDSDITMSGVVENMRKLRHGVITQRHIVANVEQAGRLHFQMEMDTKLMELP